MKIWKNDQKQTTIDLPERVYAMDTVNHLLVVAMASRLINIYDLRKGNEPMQKRESSLKYQTRVTRCFPSGEGFACGSIEGRISIDFFDPNPNIQSQKYAFKCHRIPVADDQAKKEMVYPVNSLSFHPVYQGTFASGGSDGVIGVWDRFNRKRLRQYKNYPTGISALSFNSTGDILAVASSYGFEEGEKE